MNRVEKQFRDILKKCGFQPKSAFSEYDPSNCFYTQYRFESFILDFANPHCLIAIEVDGDYWHASYSQALSTSQLLTKIRDQRKNRALEETGWLLLRFKERHILQRPERIAQELKKSILLWIKL